MTRIGVAVAGAGFIGPVHVEALRRLGLPVRGILGCDQAESQRAAQSLGLPKAYASLDELLADPDAFREKRPIRASEAVASDASPNPNRGSATSCRTFARSFFLFLTSKVLQAVVAAW